ncbi:MAG: hypothetical protein U0Z53_11325 [Blastocatellia bacterium]
MKRARLIKRNHQPPADKSAPAVKSSSIKQAVRSVREWVRTHQPAPQQQARQMFAALFAQPQTE